MRRQESPDDLLTSVEAAIIISRNSKKEVKPDYLNQLVRQKRITPHKLDARTNLYRRADVETIIVGKRGRRSKKSGTMRTNDQQLETPITGDGNL